MTLQHGSAIKKLGVFDSGIGGLSVVREIRRLCPACGIVYLADSLNHPYGPKDAQQVFSLCRDITGFMLECQVDAVVLACNTASAAALHPLRELFPACRFVGMEPAVKPAAELSCSGRVGVLATSGTFDGKPYKGVLERFAKGVEVLQQPCVELAQMIEHQQPDEVIELSLRGWIEPMLQAGVDQIALACTHYPLVLELIRKIVDGRANVIDPSLPVARQALKVIGLSGATSQQQHIDGQLELFCTSQSETLQKGCLRYLGIDIPVQPAGEIFNSSSCCSGERETC